MNYTIDLVTSWAEKLTYRIMQLSGVSEENLQKYLQAVVNKQNGIKTADETLKVPVTVLGVTFKDAASLIKIAVVVALVFAGYRAYKMYKRK